MSETRQLEAVRRVYRYGRWRRAFCGLFGAFLMLGVVAMLLNMTLIHPQHDLRALLIAAMPFALAVYVLAAAFRPRIAIEGAGIDVRGAWRERSTRLSEIAGIRARPSRYGCVRQLILKDGSSPITIPSSFKVDEDFRSWLRQVPDLDVRDREALLAEIQQNEELGATPQERLAALARAQKENFVLLALVAAVAAGFNFGPAAWVVPCGVALALAPILAAWLCWRWPLFFAIFKRKQDPRAETSYGLLVAAFGLLLHMSGFHFLSFRPLLLGMALLGAGTVATYYRAVREGSGNRVLVAILALSALYAYGAVTMADVCFDSSGGEHYAATVMGGHIARGRSTTYYLRLAPWGPVATAQDVSVSARLYHATAQGDSVCPDLHPGWLKAPWFRVLSCSPSQLP